MKAQTKPGLAAVEALNDPMAATRVRSVAELRAAREHIRTTRMRYRLRHQLAPHYILGAVWSAAWLARLAVWITKDAEGVALVTAGVTAAAAVIVALVLRRRHGRRVRTWLYACLASAVTWLSIAAGVGITWSTTALLAGLGYGLAIPWWRAHRIPNPPDPDAHVAPVAEPMLIDTSVPGLWAANVASRGGALPESYLTDPELGPTKERYTGHLRAGRQSLATAMVAMTLVASGLHVAPEDVIVERHPSGDASLFALTVVRQSPIKVSQPYPGPQWEYDPASRVGNAFLGPYADGEGRGRWKVFTKNSMWGGVVIGGAGSGKSRLLEGLVCSMRASGLVTTFYCDPQGGTSSDALASTAHWAARGNDQIMAVLRGVYRLLKWRGIENSARGRGGFTPSRARPGIAVVIDECHMIFGDPRYGAEATYIAEQVARIGRKLGMVLILASQEGDQPTFGGNASLRANVRMGNTVVLRTTNRMTQGVLALDFDPLLLPELPGYGYTVAAVGSTDRTAPFRAYYLDELDDDELDDVHAGGDPRRGTAHWWLARYPDAFLDEDPVALRALGQPYLDRNATVEAARAALHDDLDALLSGRIDPLADTATPAPAAATTGEAEAAGFGAVVNFPGALDLTAPPPPATPTVTVTGPTSSPTGPAGLTKAQHDVYQAITAGTTAKGEIVKATGLSDSGVRKALGELIQRGDVVRAGHGRYALGTGRPPSDAIDVAVDELLQRALELVVTSQLGSASMLARKLPISVEQARWLIDRLEDAGAVGPADGDQPRPVLITADQLDDALRELRTGLDPDAIDA